MKYILAFALGAVTVFMMMSYRKPKLATQTDKPDRQPTLQEQLACSAAADRQYKREGWLPEDKVVTASHYNPKLGHCYALYGTISIRDEKPFSRDVVTDPVEGKRIGEGAWSSGESLVCKIDTPDGGSRTCGTSTEFELFAADIYEVSW